MDINDIAEFGERTERQFVGVLEMLFLRCPASKEMEESVEGRGPRVAEVTLLCKQRLEEEDRRSRQGVTVRNEELMH